MSLEVGQKSTVGCPSCGQQNPAGWLVCASCHAPLRPDDPMTSQLGTEETYRHHRRHRKTSRLALASLALGVVGIFPPAGVLAIILGHAAQLQIHRHRQELRGRDVAKLGLTLGYFGVAIFAVLFLALRNSNYFTSPEHAAVTASKATASAERNDPFYKAIQNRPAMPAAERENKGVLLVKALQQAETNYRTGHPNVGYTCVLEELFQTGFDESMLQLSVETGYTISITDCTPDTKGVREGYRAFATPPAGKGTLLCSDEKGVIRSSDASSNDACLQSGKPVAVQ